MTSRSKEEKDREIEIDDDLARLQPAEIERIRRIFTQGRHWHLITLDPFEQPFLPYPPPPFPDFTGLRQSRGSRDEE